MSRRLLAIAPVDHPDGAEIHLSRLISRPVSRRPAYTAAVAQSPEIEHYPSHEWRG